MYYKPKGKFRIIHKKQLKYYSDQTHYLPHCFLLVDGGDK